MAETQRRAYVLADNRLSLDAGWDEDLLRSELVALSALEFYLPLTGFSDAVLGKLMPGIEEGDAVDPKTLRKTLPRRWRLPMPSWRGG